MKKILAVICVLFIPYMGVQGQDFFSPRTENLSMYDFAPYHFGFHFGLSVMDFTISPIDSLHLKPFLGSDVDDILPIPDSIYVMGIRHLARPGFTVGIIGSLRLNSHLDLRFIPSLSFGERILQYDLETIKVVNDVFVDSRESVVQRKRIASTYIFLPLQIKYSSKKYHNFKMYAFGGAKYTIDLASLMRKKSEESNKILMKLERNDIAMELGAGYNYYFSYFKFGLEVSVTKGLNHIMVQENNLYANSIDKLKSNIFQLSITIE